MKTEEVHWQQSGYMDLWFLGQVILCSHRLITSQCLLCFPKSVIHFNDLFTYSGQLSFKYRSDYVTSPCSKLTYHFPLSISSSSTRIYNPYMIYPMAASSHRIPTVPSNSWFLFLSTILFLPTTLASKTWHIHSSSWLLNLVLLGILFLSYHISVSLASFRSVLTRPSPSAVQQSLAMLLSAHHTALSHRVLGVCWLWHFLRLDLYLMISKLLSSNI